MAWPAFGAAGDDGFPFSTYPMFAQRRGRVHEVVSARAVFADGHSQRVPPELIANAETMQAIRTLSRAVRAGGSEVRELCVGIASRLADSELRAAVRVELVTERVDAIDYLAGRGRAESSRVHARCSVGGAR